MQQVAVPSNSNGFFAIFQWNSLQKFDMERLHNPFN